jgi:circadian clock protein KaiC
MQREIEKFQPDRVVVDSLSALERIGSIRQFRDFTIGLTSHIKSLLIPGFMTSVSGALMGGPSVTEAHISTLTDTIILLRYIELSGQMSRGITVLKMRGSAHDKTIHEFAINETGIVIGSPFEGTVNFMTDGRGPLVNPGTGANAELFSEEY